MWGLCIIRITDILSVESRLNRAKIFRLFSQEIELIKNETTSVEELINNSL